MSSLSPRSGLVGSERLQQTSPPLPARSPLRPSLSQRDSTELPTPPPSEDDDHQQEMEQTELTTSTTAATTMSLSKRQHALHELLASERAYASDLALVREVYIPLAIGQPIMIDLPTPPDSASSSTSSSASSSRVPSSLTESDLPMTTDDAKIIFNNISELALFSDTFCEELEQALGSVLPGGAGEDRVGELFLRVIPELEKPYKTYITRQATADEHLQSLRLTKSPALEAYFTQTRLYSSHISHAWDLHSLLIKPVQRLLKYPLLLSTIIAETPDSHPDKLNLKKAKDMVEAVARSVNEEKRRAEVVKGILMGEGKKKLTPASIGVAASVNIGKMKSLRRGKEKEKDGAVGGLASPTMPDFILGVGSDTGGTSSEALKVAQLTTELKRIELFAQQLAKHIIDYVRSMQLLTSHLITWSSSFARVIGLNDEQGSEAFDAFLAVLEDHLLPLSKELEATVKERLLRDVARLISTIRKPMKLVESMEEQEPYHYHLLNTPFSPKSRPPPALLEASSNYLALRGQLASELPVYLGLLHKGLTLSLHKLTEIQQAYWAELRDAWRELWDMLRVEGEMNAGAEETVGVWSARWSDVDQGVRGLGIVSALHLTSLGKEKSLKRGSQEQVKTSMPAPIAEHYMHSPEREGKEFNPYPEGNGPYPSLPRSPVPQHCTPRLSHDRPHPVSHQSFEPSSTIVAQSPPQQFSSDKEASKQSKAEKGNPQLRTRTSAVAVTNVLSALEPAHSPTTKSPTTENKNRGRGYSDASMTTSPSSSTHTPSLYTSSTNRESYDSASQYPPSYSSKNDRPQADTWEKHFSSPDFDLISAPAALASAFSLPRTRSMPLPRGIGVGEFQLPVIDASPVMEEFIFAEKGPEERPGHKRKTSFKRKILGGSKGSPPLSQTTPTPTMSAATPRPSTLPANVSRVSSPQPKPRASLPTNFHSQVGLPVSTLPQPTQTTRERRSSWSSSPSRYLVVVVHPCRPPQPVAYHGFPFFTLIPGDEYDVLHEAGHPSLHKRLPLYVDDGEDCLLLCRARKKGDSTVGWALASFLEPVEGSG